MNTMTSLLSASHRPVTTRRRGGRLAACAVLGGIVLATVWSYRFVDGTIGDNVANGVLGFDAKDTAIAGPPAGAVFGLVWGLAGTFTACNIAVFSVLPDVARSRRETGRALLEPLGWLST